PAPKPTLFPYTTLFRSDGNRHARIRPARKGRRLRGTGSRRGGDGCYRSIRRRHARRRTTHRRGTVCHVTPFFPHDPVPKNNVMRSEEHTSELQSRENLV